MLNYDEFKDLVSEKFLEYFPEEYKKYEMDVQTVYRTNEKLDGISFKRSAHSIAPTIYIQDMYRDYRICNDINDVMKRAAETYIEHAELNIDTKFLEQAPTDRIYMSLINAADNAELLADSPYREFQDLAITYRILVNENDTGVMSTRINNNLAAKYGLTEQNLYDIAYKNTERLFPSVVYPMNDVIRQLARNDNIPDEVIDVMLPDNNNMYVVTNNRQVGGATAVLYEENLHQLAESYGSDLYVLPSSIHEMIVLPETDIPVDDLADMVCEVNKTVVQEKDRLSNQVYKYDSQTRKLSIVSNSPDKIKDQERKTPKTQNVKSR